jgi:putative oxidoreductase
MNDKTRDLGLLLLRLSGVLLLGLHGWDKLSSFAIGEGDGFVAAVARMGFPLPLVWAWAAVLAESVGALLLAVGLFTRTAAVGAAATMAVAAFLVHRALEQGLNFLGLREVSPEQLQKWGNPELPLLYLIVFLAIALLGPGQIALDRFVSRKKGRSRAK